MTRQQTDHHLPLLTLVRRRREGDRELRTASHEASVSHQCACKVVAEHLRVRRFVAHRDFLHAVVATHHHQFLGVLQVYPHHVADYIAQQRTVDVAVMIGAWHVLQLHLALRKQMFLIFRDNYRLLHIFESTLTIAAFHLLYIAEHDVAQHENLGQIQFERLAVKRFCHHKPHHQMEVNLCRLCVAGIHQPCDCTALIYSIDESAHGSSLFYADAIEMRIDDARRKVVGSSLYKEVSSLIDNAHCCLFAVKVPLARDIQVSQRALYDCLFVFQV